MSEKVIKITPYLLERYKEERKDVNNISWWYNRIYGCPILQPQTMIFRVTPEVWLAWWDDHDNSKEVIREYLEEYVILHMHEDKTYFLKNGTFSNKFYFANCHCTRGSIEMCISKINYSALTIDAGGTTEIVLRNYIWPTKGTDTIYSGMPLRTEFRLFYDAEIGKVKYCVPYWQYDVMKGKLCPEDMAVFERNRERLEREYAEYESLAIKTVEEGLVGNKLHEAEDGESAWSADLLLQDGKLWLIDMAAAWRSYFWDKERFYGEI